MALIVEDEFGRKPIYLVANKDLKCLEGKHVVYSTKGTVFSLSYPTKEILTGIIEKYPKITCIVDDNFFGINFEVCDFDLLDEKYALERIKEIELLESEEFQKNLDMDDV